MKARAIEALTPTHRRWAACACCHRRFTRRGNEPDRRGAWLGQPSLTAPAVAICVECLILAIRAAGGA